MCTSRLKHTDKYSDNKTTFLLKKKFTSVNVTEQNRCRLLLMCVSEFFGPLLPLKLKKKNKNKEEERKRRRHVNGSYCWVITFRLLACKCCRCPGEQTIKTFKKNPREAQVTESYFISKTSKAIKSSLKINYTHLCLNSCYVQVFLSDSQNTFSQWLILIDHNNRNNFFRNHTKREKKKTYI